MNDSLTANQKRLMRRYLLWCYKTTKEDLDRIDRYFTQSKVDDFLLESLIETEEFQSAQGDHLYKKKVQGFEEYKLVKLRKAEEQKYQAEGVLNSDYLYLMHRLDAISKAIEQFFGKKELDRIIDLYEEEMTRRILSARDHS